MADDPDLRCIPSFPFGFALDASTMLALLFSLGLAGLRRLRRFWHAAEPILHLHLPFSVVSSQCFKPSALTRRGLPPDFMDRANTMSPSGYKGSVGGASGPDAEARGSRGFANGLSHEGLGEATPSHHPLALVDWPLLDSRTAPGPTTRAMAVVPESRPSASAEAIADPTTDQVHLTSHASNLQVAAESRRVLARATAK